MSNDFAYVIEIQGLYDGWSIGVTHDGEYVNRWPKDDFRYARTQEVIDRYEQESKSVARRVAIQEEESK